MGFEIYEDMDPTVKIRIKIEEKIASRVIDDLLANDYLISVDDGMVTTVVKSADKQMILHAMSSADDDRLYVYKKDDPFRLHGWIRFFYGNDGWDVVNDYTLSLDHIMVPIEAWAENAGYLD